MAKRRSPPLRETAPGCSLVLWLPLRSQFHFCVPLLFPSHDEIRVQARMPSRPVLAPLVSQPIGDVSSAKVRIPPGGTADNSMNHRRPNQFVFVARFRLWARPFCWMRPRPISGLASFVQCKPRPVLSEQRLRTMRVGDGLFARTCILCLHLTQTKATKPVPRRPSPDSHCWGWRAAPSQPA
jgi:hypothetical protein